MKRNTIIFALILTLIAILTCTLVACNNPNNLIATFELDDNDGIADFSLRRGIVFQYKVSELNKIDGVDASWKVSDNGKVQISVSNVKANSDDVRKILNSNPALQFKTENSASAPAQFVGEYNIRSISLSYDKSSIQVEFTAQGIETINDYLNRQLYIYLGDEYLTSMTSRIILTNGNPTVTITVPSNSNPMFAETLTAQLNAGAFGLKIKTTNIK